MRVFLFFVGVDEAVTDTIPSLKTIANRPK